MNIKVIIPTFNERDNIGGIIERIFAHLPDAGVLVVDDNSPDGTAGVVRSLQPKWPNLQLVVRTTERGFGSAYIAGFRHLLDTAGTDAIVTMDADFSHDPAYIPAMLEQISKCDVVVGSRYTGDGGFSGCPLWRRILSRGGNTYVRMVTGLPISDCSSGFNLIRADALRRLDLSSMNSTGYAFLMELKYALWRVRANIREVPIIFGNRGAGESKLSGRIIREGLKAPWRVRAQYGT